MPCLCGADDCPTCFPQHFTRIGGVRVFVGEDFDPKAAEDAADDAAERAAEAAKDRAFDFLDL